MFSEAEKIAAAILAAKAVVGTDLHGYVRAYKEALKLIRQEDMPKKGLKSASCA